MSTPDFREDQLELDGVGPPPRKGESLGSPQTQADAKQVADYTTTETDSTSAYDDEPQYVREFYAHWVCDWQRAEDVPSQLRQRQCAKRRLPVFEDGGDGDMASPRWWR